MSSSNGLNECEDTEMADCDGEKAVTMMDVLKEQEDFEEDANAVLGASDDKNCTYTKGYIKRQALYACMTCCSEARDDPTKRAGVCLACSLNCHENHDLIELYTKRNFRCDCGNPKFNSHPCQYTPNKNDLNDENIYNQNFSGLYCICHRPYPDPDVTNEEEMIQCIVCEDWLHSSHLDAVVPANDQYTEMICKTCMDKNEFLHDYSDFAVNKETVDVDKEESVDILNTSSDNNETKCNGINDTEMLEADEIKSNANVDQSDIDNLTKGSTDTEENTTVKEDTKGMEQTDTELESAKEKSNEEPPIPNQEDQVSENITADDKKDNIENNDTTTSETDVTNENVSKQDSQIQSNEGPKDKDETVEVKVSNEDQKESITETEQTKNDEEPKPSNETSDSVNLNEHNVEKSSVNEEKEETKLPETANNSDSRTQEQVEEDLLLADPVEAAQENKNDTTPNTTNTDKIVDENKSEPEQAMDTTESVDITKDKVDKPDDKTDTNSETESLPVITPAEEMETTENLKDKENMSGETEQESVSKPTEDITEVSESQSVAAPEPAKDKAEENESESVPGPELTKEIRDGNNQTVSNEEEKSMETNTESEAAHSADKNSTENNENKIPNDELTDKPSTAKDIPKRKLSTEETEDSEVKKPKLDTPQCVRPKGVKKIHKGATFWPSNFRLKLCTCSECISMYKDLSVLFLTDPEDTTVAYERLGKERTGGKPASQYEKGMAALSSLGHVQQINALTEYGKMRDKLLEFLKSFKERKVIVKEEDIKAFFAGMKPVREPDGVYFCR